MFIVARVSVDVRGHGEALDALLNLASEESRVVVHESKSNLTVPLHSSSETVVVLGS